MKKRHLPLGEALANLLANAGVKHVFGFPGETSLPLYIGMQRTLGLQHVLARCPRCTGYMAEGYARLSGTVGICDAPGGIGSPFVAPALHEALNSSTPLLFLASGVDSQKRNRWTTSQCNQQGLFSAISKSTYLLDSPEQLMDTFHKALHVCASPRTGPVFFEIPADIFSGTCGISEVTNISVDYPRYRLMPNPEQLNKAIEILRQAKSPVIVAGGGVFLSKAVDDLRLLHKKTNIPIATTLNGKGAVDETNQFSLGVTGAKGSVEVNAFVENADCILVLGSKLGDKSTNGYAWPHNNQNVIHVDVDAKELCHSQLGYLPILSDIRELVKALISLLAEWKSPSVTLPVRRPFWEEGSTHSLCKLLSETLADDAIIVADASVSSGWAGAAITFSGKQRLITPRGSGSIGYALPAAIGAQFARPESQVIVIGGDGGLAIAMHEMETAARYNLPIIYFLLNNRRLGLIDKHATALLNGNPVSSEFIDIDWCQIANSFGWDSERIDNPLQLNTLLPTIFSTKKPLLIEYRISPDEMAPDFFIALKKHDEQRKFK